MTPRPGSSNWACDVRLFAKIHPALCDDAINQSKQLQPASHAMRVGKETMILNMLPAESESSFSVIEESEGSDIESTSEKDFGTILSCFEPYVNEPLANP